MFDRLDPECMPENFDATRGLIVAEAASMDLVRAPAGWPRII